MGAGMNVLIVGNGSGSWAMRGQQLGNAIGARVTSIPTPQDWAWADVIVLVKRWGARLASAARATGKPVIWDAVDFWSQPGENGVSEAVAKQMLRNQIAAIRPALVIGATQAMADAAEGVYLPHHSWRGLEPQRPQREVTSIAYQGNPTYLGQWGRALERICRAQKWQFVINPVESLLWMSDLVVAFRDGPWDGWICREWKSGVKLGNAIAAGRPVLTQPTAAWREMGPLGSAVESVDELEGAIEAWRPLAAREVAYERCRALAPTYRLPAIADHYRELLMRVPCLA